uniref:Uncharacterized protein n=1 Tax=Caenorhabditis japonica TaxID=281687 RepID=A0A8R1HVB7_CAEJA
MSSDESYFLDPWQTKEVLDPDVETKSYESIIQMVFDHQLPCIGHIILSNYTWKQSDLTRLIPFYSSLGDDFDQNLSKLQQSCEPVSFSAITRHHCYVNFGVDGELKFYQREMYRQALEDLRISKSKSAIISNAVNVKPESGKKLMEQPKWTPIRVKPEKKNSDEEDFCEVIETVSANSKSKKLKSPKQEIIVDRLEKQKDSERDVKDFPEKYLLEDLDKDELPMYFKTKFRKLVEQNQMLRDEIKDYKDLIQLKIAEKKQKLK